MLLSYDLTTFQILGQKLSNFFFGFMVQTMTPKRHFEINWPLPMLKSSEELTVIIYILCSFRHNQELYSKWWKLVTGPPPTLWLLQMTEDSKHIFQNKMNLFSYSLPSNHDFLWLSRSSTYIGKSRFFHWLYSDKLDIVIKNVQSLLFLNFKKYF